MPQYMNLNQAGWPTVCPRCTKKLDWQHTESVPDATNSKLTAYFVPVCQGRCTQDQMQLSTIDYPNLRPTWTPKPAGPLRQGVTVAEPAAPASDAGDGNQE